MIGNLELKKKDEQRNTMEAGNIKCFWCKLFEQIENGVGNGA